jgi:hypothetical protein
MDDGARFEQYRIVVISAWPESELKQAALASACAALDREMAFAQVATWQAERKRIGA